MIKLFLAIVISGIVCLLGGIAYLVFKINEDD